MAYVDGFVIPVARGQRDAFVDHARRIDPIFLEFGATRVVECWGDDVPPGTTTDFFRAVAATGDEAVSSRGSNGPTRRRAMRAWSGCAPIRG